MTETTAHISDEEVQVLCRRDGDRVWELARELRATRAALRGLVAVVDAYGSGGYHVDPSNDAMQQARAALPHQV